MMLHHTAIHRTLPVLAFALMLGACSEESAPADAAPDRGRDLGSDLSPDGRTDARREAGGDGSAGLAVGQYRHLTPDTAGVISASIPASPGEEYLVLLASLVTTPQDQFNYSTKLLSGTSAAMELRPPLPAAPPHRCRFHEELAAILGSRPDALHRPAPYALSTQPPKKDDVRSFKISDGGTTTTIQAKALHVDATVAIWADTTSLPTAAISAQEVQEMADGLGKIIVPRERICFGQESDLDGDGVISFLFSPLVSKTAMAYFSPCDLLDPKIVPYCSDSNQMELLYLSPPNLLTPPYNTARALLETAAHELQHAIYFHRKYLKNNLVTELENPYITEGLSALAQDLTGYQSGNLYVVMGALTGVNYLGLPNLTDKAISSYVSGNTKEGYSYDGLMRGGAYLVLRYLYDQAGGDSVDSAGKLADKGGIAWLRAFMDSKDLGTINYTARTNLTLDQMILRFWTAMAMSNRGGTGKPLSTDPTTTFLPTAIDPLTSRQRGCNLFGPLHGGMSLGGPKLGTFARADGILIGGGADILQLTPNVGDTRLAFTISTAPEAKAIARLIRVK